MSLTKEQQESLNDFVKTLSNYADDDQPIDPCTYTDSCGDTALHIAAFQGNAKVVQILIDLGLDVNGLGDMGCTPLHYAVMAKSREVVDILLAAGAANNIKNQFGQFPLHSMDEYKKQQN